MTRAHGLAAFAVAAMVTCGLAQDARADRRAVRVSVVSDPEIRAVMHEVLAGTPEVSVVGRGRAELELRGSVAELQRRSTHDGVEVRARVTVIVADARGGAVRAMLTGRAGARGGGDVDRLSRNALRGAVRGALRSLAEHGRTLAHR